MLAFNRLSGLLWTICNYVFLHSVNAGPFIPKWKSIETVPAAQANDTASNVTFISSNFGLDAQHVHPINASTWEWYYFDAVSTDGLTSISIVLYTAPFTGFFGGGPPDDVLVAEVFASVPGDSFFFDDFVYGTETVISSVGNGASAIWKGTGFQFEGECDLSDYKVQIDSPTLGVKGHANFKSIAPAHYPCGPVAAGQKLDVMPHIGWSNAIPDAHAEVDLVVNGTRVNFTGIGYHDKNWGSVPFVFAVGSWYWGHGRLGPYSIVWWDTLTPGGREFVSGYVARDGAIVSAGCTGVKVRPSGPDAVYPPVYGAPDPSSFHIEMDLGLVGRLVFEVEQVAHTSGESQMVYDRWTGKLSGGIVGGKNYTGMSIYEQFVFPQPK